MSRTQFLILNLVGGLCSLLIAAVVILGRLNGALTRSVVETGHKFSQAEQIRNTTQNLVLRIAQAGQTDPALQALLAKHQFKVNSDPNSGTNAAAKPPS